MDCGVAAFEAPETSGDNNAEVGDADADASKTVRLPGMMHFIFLSCGLHMVVWSCESEVAKGVAELGPVLWPCRGTFGLLAQLPMDEYIYRGCAG